MTRQQIKNKIKDLQFWIDHNPNHPDYHRKLSELKQCEQNLSDLGKYGWKPNQDTAAIAFWGFAVQQPAPGKTNSLSAHFNKPGARRIDARPGEPQRRPSPCSGIGRSIDPRTWLPEPAVPMATLKHEIV